MVWLSCVGHRHRNRHRNRRRHRINGRVSKVVRREIWKSKYKLLALITSLLWSIEAIYSAIDQTKVLGSRLSPFLGASANVCNLTLARINQRNNDIYVAVLVLNRVALQDLYYFLSAVKYQSRHEELGKNVPTTTTNLTTPLYVSLSLSLSLHWKENMDFIERAYL